MGYVVKKEFRGILELSTQIDGKTVALNTAHKRTEPDTAKGPGKVVDIPLATQSELKSLYEAGNPCIEKEDEAPAVVQAKVEKEK